MPRLNDTKALTQQQLGHLPPKQIWAERQVNPRSGECRSPGSFLPMSDCRNTGPGRGSLGRAKDELCK